MELFFKREWGRGDFGVSIKYYATVKKNKGGGKSNEENLYTLINSGLQHVLGETEQSGRQCLLSLFLTKEMEIWR